MSGPCLSSSVAGRPLRPATRHSLGEPLPHQLADRPRALQRAPGCPGFGPAKIPSQATCGINSPFGELSPTLRQIAHVLRTLTPLDITCIATNNIPFDLHVLSTPPAFVLSQNQTLREKRMGIHPAQGEALMRTEEPKVCAGDLLKSPLNLTDYFLLKISANRLSISLRVSFDLILNVLKSKI